MSQLVERIAVLSDIHSNHLALKAVVKHAQRQNVTGFWCLGDVLGRGPAPIPTALHAQHLYDESDPADQAGWLAGNHDYYVLEKAPIKSVKVKESTLSALSGVSNDAADMIRHNQAQLASRKKLIDWLNKLPIFSEPRPGIFMAHGAFAFDRQTNAVIEVSAYERYVYHDKQISDQILGLRAQYGSTNIRILLNGHTHITRLAELGQVDERTQDYPIQFGATMSFECVGQQSVYINPGSVGFPREPNVCPTYAIITLYDKPDRFDVVFHTVSYDSHAYFEETRSGPGPANSRDFPDRYRNELKRFDRTGLCADSEDSETTQE